MTKSLIVELLRSVKLKEARTALESPHLEISVNDHKYLNMLLEAHEGHYDLAKKIGDELLATQGNDPFVRFYLARIEFALGNWFLGLEYFDSIRGQGPFGGPPHSGTRPLWCREPLLGKTIFLSTEGGLGDAICFSRFAKNFSELGAKVILGTYPQLYSLFSSLDGVDALVNVNSIETIPFDYWIPIMSCPRLLQIDYTDISGRAYLQVPQVSKWPELVQTNRKKIALIWHGNPVFPEDYLRSISPQKLLPILDQPDYQFFSILSPTEAQSFHHENLRYVGDEIQNPLELGQFLTMMDLVISVDTGPAHLAGSLGIPTWLLNRKMGWITFAAEPIPLKGQATPWYESMTVFHQSSWGLWDDVIESVAQRLKDQTVSIRPEPAPYYHPEIAAAIRNPIRLVPTAKGPILSLATDYFVGQALIQYGEYSFYECQLINQLLTPNAIAIEAGAHIGALTLELVEAVGPNGFVHAFEPQPKLAQILRANLGLRNITNVCVYELGLAQEEGSTFIEDLDYHRLGNFGSVNLNKNKNTHPAHTISIQLTTIDDWASQAQVDRLDLIKMDIEGMELEALRGAVATIKKFRPILVLEFDRPEQHQQIKELLGLWDYEYKLTRLPLYHDNNFKKNRLNIFKNLITANLVALPREHGRSNWLNNLGGMH